jgi:AcrR family transcriptional regulator
VVGIARRVGFVPSAIYRHFASKDEILDATVAFIGQRLLENVEAVECETGEPLEQLRRLLDRHVQFIRENRAVPRLVFSEEMHRNQPARKKRLYQVIHRYLGRIAAIVRVGQAAGIIRQDVPPDTVAMLFLGLVQPAAMLWEMSEGTFDVTRHTERAWKLFAAMLAPG